MKKLYLVLVADNFRQVHAYDDLSRQFPMVEISVP